MSMVTKWKSHGESLQGYKCLIVLNTYKRKNFGDKMLIEKLLQRIK